MKQKFVVLEGDGIGPEVMASALEVVVHLQKHHALQAEPVPHRIGGQAIRTDGTPLPPTAREDCLTHGVLLLGAVGDPAFDHLPPEKRPEKALLQLRRELGLYANLRPVKVHACLAESSPLRSERVRNVDLLFTRELTGGIYFGSPRGEKLEEGHRVAVNTEVYSDWEIERIARVAFQAAGQRQGKVTSVDKSNVLETSQLWRRVVEEVSAAFPSIQLEHMLVDNCAMQLVARPEQFDVLLTSNLFGDILSDEAAMLTGSIGMLPSASIGGGSGQSHQGLYEPVHGSAPDIAGKGIANPLAALGSLAMMLRFSLERADLADLLDDAIVTVLEAGVRPADLSGPGPGASSTEEVTAAVIGALAPPG